MIKNIFSALGGIAKTMAGFNRGPVRLSMSLAAPHPAHDTAVRRPSPGGRGEQPVNKFGLQAAERANGMGQWGGSRDEYANQEYADKTGEVLKRAQDLHFNCADIRGHHFGRTARIAGKGVHYKSIVKAEEVGLTEKDVAVANAALNRKRRLHSRSGGFDAQDKGRSEGILQVQAVMTAMALGGCLIKKVVRTEANRVLPLAIELIPGSRVSQPLDLMGDTKVHLGVRYTDEHRSRVEGYYVKKTPRTVGNNSVPYPEWDYVALEDGIFLEQVDIAGLDRALPDVVAVTRLVFNRSELVDAAVESARNQAHLSVIFEVAPGQNPYEVAEDAINSNAAPVGDVLPEGWRMVNGVSERYVANGTKALMNTANLPGQDFKGFNEVTDSRLTRGLNTRGSEFTRKVDTSYSGGMQERQIDNPNVEQMRKNFQNAWNRVHEWVLDACYLWGAVSMPGYCAATRIFWTEARVQFPGEVPLNPVDHVNSQTKRIAAGLSSYSHECEENGDDYEDVVGQLADDYLLRRRVESDKKLPDLALEPLGDLPEIKNAVDPVRDGDGDGIVGEGRSRTGMARKNRISGRVVVATEAALDRFKKMHAAGTPKKFYANLAGARVDLENRRIIGFAVATIGPALGKGESIDAETLKQICELGNRGPVRCRFNHPGGDSISSDLGDLIGQATTFRIDGDKVIADFQAVSVEANPLGIRLLHYAKDTPDIFGASMVFEGQAEKGKTRVETLFAVDFVDIPAANANGLFSGEKPMEKCKAETEQDGKLTVTCNGVKYEIEMPAKKEEDKEVKKDAAEEPEAKKDAASAEDDKATDKEIKKDSASGAAKTFSAADVEAARLDGQKKAGNYATEFDAVMDASGFKGEDRDKFRTDYFSLGSVHGIDVVKKFALERAATRTKGIGGGGVQGEGADVAGESAKRFAAKPELRLAWGCNTDNKDAPEYKAALVKYSAAMAKTATGGNQNFGTMAVK